MQLKQHGLIHDDALKSYSGNQRFGYPGAETNHDDQLTIQICCYGEISISAGYLGRYPRRLVYNNSKYTTLDYYSRIGYNSIIDSYYELYVSHIIGQTVALSIFTHRSTVGRRP